MLKKCEILFQVFIRFNLIFGGLILLAFSGFSQSLFSGDEHIIFDNTFSAEGAYAVYAADLDGDGDKDVVGAFSNGNRLGWYEHLGVNSKVFGKVKIIASNVNAVNAVVAADFDLDGDLDLLSASGAVRGVDWFENLDGKGNFSAAKSIGSTVGASGVFSADMNGDGAPDVLASCHLTDKVIYFEGNGDGTFSNERVLSANTVYANSILAADVDKDGDLDAVSTSSSDFKVSWFENLDGLGSFAAEQIISDSANGSQYTDVGDLDGDGDNDVVGVSNNDDELVLYFNGGNETYTSSLLASLNGAFCVFARDVDADNDLDLIVSASDADKISLFKNNGNGTFQAEIVIDNAVDNVRNIDLTDLDGDGDLDILSSSQNDDRITWYENLDGLGTYIKGDDLSRSLNAPYALALFDADNDGDLDLASASALDDKLVLFYQENGASNEFGKQQILGNNHDFANGVVAGDINGDGWQDLVVSSFDDNNIWIYWNNNGVFESSTEVSHNLERPREMHLADLDGDGDLDLTCSFMGSNELVWFKNNGSSFTAVKSISSDYTANYGYRVVDVDSDEDLDIVMSSYGSGKVVVFDNNGSGNFTQNEIASISGVTDVVAGDMDNDGDMDLMAVSYSEAILYFIRNSGGLNFNTPINVAEGLNQAIRLEVRDMDLDNDSDVVVSILGGGGISGWFRNTGSGLELVEAIATNAPSMYYFQMADIDRDKDWDVVNAVAGDNRITWSENLLVPRIRWDGEGVDSLWESSTNWTVDRILGVSDDIYLDHQFVAGPYSVLVSENASIGELNITDDDITLYVAENVSLEYSSIRGNGRIVLLNGASLIPSAGASGYVEGNFEIYRDKPSGQPLGYYNFYSSPVSAGHINMLPGANRSYVLTKGAGPSSSYYQWHKGAMEVARGYAVTHVSQAKFEGVANNGDITIGIEKNDGRFNLIGNPYPSAISAQQFVQDNASELHEATLYFWNQMDANNRTDSENARANFLAVNATGVSAYDQEAVYLSETNIASCQGFGVLAKNDGDITFRNEQRNANNGNFKSAGEPLSNADYAWFSLGYNGVEVNMLIAFGDQATQGKDFYYDASTPYNKNALQLLSKTKDEYLVINALPKTDTARVPISLCIPMDKRGKDVIADLQLDKFRGDEELELWLYNKDFDHYTRVYERVPIGLFVDENEVWDDKYELVFIRKSLKQNTGIETFESNAELSVEVKSDRIMVSNQSRFNCTYKIYDLNGVLLFEDGVDAKSNRSFRHQSGIYLMHLFNEEQSINRKIILE